ncbi:MAG: 16S rRNA processing protein RimM [Kofleriaceae bacterium]|nr:16S rRNA processing protein RimM [Kofleriaceae bacterium]
MRGDNRIEIGGVARAHGIRGEIVIVTHDPDSATLGSVSSIYIDGIERKVAAARDTQRGWLVVLEGVTTRTEAESFRGKSVEVDRSDLELADDDVILDDLVGCEVRLPDGSPWGTIYAVDAGAHQDLLVIHDGELERLLPLVDEFVTDIDVDAGIVTVDPPADLPASKMSAKEQAIAEKHRRAAQRGVSNHEEGEATAELDADANDAELDDDADAADADAADADDADADAADADDADADDADADAADADAADADDDRKDRP